MSTEKQLTARSGWPFLVVGILALAAAVWMFVTGIMAVDAADTMGEPASPMAIARLVGSIPVAFAGIIVLAGLFTLQPGQARVCVLFGRYDGTVRAEGLL